MQDDDVDTVGLLVAVKVNPSDITPRAFDFDPFIPGLKKDRILPRKDERENAGRQQCSQLVAMALQLRLRKIVKVALPLQTSLRSRRRTMEVLSHRRNYPGVYCWMRGARRMDIA